METRKKQLEFWKQKLAEHQKKYGELKEQSPNRWWHDEYFDASAIAQHQS